jgi:arginine:agmatine antiporter
MQNTPEGLNQNQSQNRIQIRQIGLIAAILLIIRNMLGSGVFMLPAILAKIGSISSVGWVVAMVGVIALALSFSKLAELCPLGAGPYAYAKQAFGDYIGYQTNYAYTIASIIGNVSIVTVMLGYVVHILPVFGNVWYSVMLEIIIIWLFTYLNIKGAKIIAFIQGASLFLALIPIVFLAVFGWFWFDSVLFFKSWNVSGVSNVSAINLSFNNIMFAFIGIESACVSSAVIKNPQRNIPLATVFGVLLATVLYISTCTVIMGVVPHDKLISSSAPFAQALQNIFGFGAGIVIAICAIVNCIGAFAGWTMVIGQTTRAAALDGLFPKIFTKINDRGVPSMGLVVVAAIMTIAILLTASATANEQFGKIITMSVVLYLIPYIYSGFSILIIGYKKIGFKVYLWYAMLGVLAALFCIWSIYCTDSNTLRLSSLVIILSGFFYAITRAGKTKIK